MPTTDINTDDLAAVNEPPRAVEREIERLIAESQAVIDGILWRHTRSRTLMTPEDREDIHSTIHLRLVMKLRMAAGEPEAIQNFRGYVATLAYNVVNDFLRKRFPERARLKARLRYALTHDARLAIWTSPAGLLLCGLAAWQGRQDGIAELPRPIPAIDLRDSAMALEQIFLAVQRPVLLDEVVDAIAERWSVVDHDPAPLDCIGEAAGPAARVEDLDFARALWAEIRELPVMQRKALLLNLRYGGDTNVISLLILSGIARFDEIADALEMSRTGLASIWRRLPIDDATLAERFGVTRQQVINLRKAARARLSRRLSR